MKLKKPTLNKVWGKGYEIRRTETGFKVTLEFNMNFKYTMKFYEEMSDNAQTAKRVGFEMVDEMAESN